MIMFFFARAACHVRVHASCNLVRPDVRAECRRGWDRILLLSGTARRRSHVTPTGTAFFIHGRDSGSYTHVQRARVTVRVNAGVHRCLGAIMPKKSRKKKSRDM